MDKGQWSFKYQIALIFSLIKQNLEIKVRFAVKKRVASYFEGGHEESNCGVMEVSANAVFVLSATLQRGGPCE